MMVKEQIFLKGKVGLCNLIRDKGLPSPDLNEDGSIDVHDFSIFLFHRGRTDSPRYDLNLNGVVNSPDFSILLSLF